jgi:excisionase family DNA binding protein
MPYTLAEAAQATGLNRSTILRAIKNGRISGVRDELGAWSVEPAELHRVFPPAQAELKAVPKAVPGPAQLDLELRIRAELAEARLGDLRHALEDMRRARDDAIEERNRWRGQAERLALPAPEESQATLLPAAGGRGGGRADHAALYDGSSPAS